MGSFIIQRFNFSSNLIILFLLTSQSLVIQTIGHENNNPTAYELLKDFDFPIGLLPKGVIGYDFEPSSGKFSAYFNGGCSFSLEGSYRLKYKNTIIGYLSKGKISNLEGVSVKLWFMWVNIVEVSRRGNDLEFSVGMAAAGFPVDNFEECPQCGCGMNCNGVINLQEQVRRFGKIPLVSSV